MSFFSNPPQNNTNPAAGSLFSGASNPSTTNSSTGTSNPTLSVFGAPFGANTGGSIFGAGTTSNAGGGGLFGGGNSASSATPASTGSNLFGGAANTTSSTTTPLTTGSGLFGNAPRTSTPALGSGGGFFGGANTSSTPGIAGGGLFGGGANTSTPIPAPATGTGGGLFGTGGSTNTPSTGSIFGAPKADSDATKSTTTNTNPLFGGSSAFSLPKPGDTGAKPSSTFFSQPTTTPSTGTTSATGSTATTSTPTIGGGIFSLPPKPAAGATTSTPTGTSNLFGGGLFSQPAPTATTSPGEKVPSSFSLGGNKDSAAPATTPTSNIFGGSTASKDGEKKEITPTAAPAFNLFVGGKPAEKKDETTALREGEKKDTSSTTTATGAASLIAVQPPSMLKGKTLEEIVNRWTSDLETNVREFNKFAAEVSVWDRVLIENGNNIAALYSHVLAAERQQNDINESLEHIEQQQKDLATTLDHYERVSQEILGGSLRTLDTGPADNERDKNYMLATDLYTQLDDLSGSLTQMIDSVNALSIASKPDESADDPMSQISQILSSHLESLQWIDGAVREVENKTHEVEKRVKESGHNLSGSRARGFGANR